MKSQKDWRRDFRPLHIHIRRDQTHLTISGRKHWAWVQIQGKVLSLLSTWQAELEVLCVATLRIGKSISIIKLLITTMVITTAIAWIPVLFIFLVNPSRCHPVIHLECISSTSTSMRQVDTQWTWFFTQICDNI
jgi:hypothetical protein